MIEIRLRSRIPAAELDAKIGKNLGAPDYNLLVTGPARVLKPTGAPLLVYLPGALARHTADPDVHAVLHGMHTVRSDARSHASGTPALRTNGIRRARPVASVVVGAYDASHVTKHCRLTAWTGAHIPDWERLRPFLRDAARLFAEHVPDRYAVQHAEADRTHPGWVVPGTPFTTLTVNNSYSTGVHQDAGDLEAGFSVLSCLRRGTYTGGRLVFPRYRTAVDMHDGDLLLMDAHEHHGNTALVCACGTAMDGPCTVCGAERISTVLYYRANMARCGTPGEEAAKQAAYTEKAATVRATKHAT